MVSLALLPSPLLGSEVWRPVAAALEDLGRPAFAVEVEGAAPRSAEEALEQFLRALPEDEDLVLVPHSNACLYVPAIASQRKIGGAVFVDGRLPPPEGGSVTNTAAENLPMLTAKADPDGLLPIWTQWWDPVEMAAHFPSPEVQAAVERQQRRLSLAYFEDAVAVPSGWARQPCAYLAFGENYRADTEQARGLGWPVQVMDGEHLEMLTQPRAVAEAITVLVSVLIP
jgi:hypothetical protein